MLLGWRTEHSRRKQKNFGKSHASNDIVFIVNINDDNNNENTRAEHQRRERRIIMRQFLLDCITTEAVTGAHR